MTGSKKIFLDTAPIVYYLENNEIYCPRMKKFWKMYGDCDYITSAVTITEYLIATKSSYLQRLGLFVVVPYS